MKRLFFALWPDEETRRELVAINRKIRMEGLRKLKPANLHATLVFLGNVDDDIATLLQQRAGEIRAEVFTLMFDQLSFWSRPRVLCLTCKEQPEAVYTLVDALTQMVADYPIELEQRRYRAHITLARKVKTRFELEFEPIHWRANSFALVESRSTEQGVSYEVLESWPLLDAGEMGATD